MSQSQPLQPEVEMKDSNDANANTQSSSITKRKRKPMDKRSEVWDHFTKFMDADGSTKAKCNYCSREYFSDSSKNGTSNLRTHLKTCNKLPLSGDSKQTQLTLQSVGGNELLKKWRFDQKASRKKLASMIIIDELPFRFVEGEGFRDFMQTTQPLFKIPSRFTIARDCYQIFLDEKKALSSYFKMSGQRVNITTDTWTSIQKIAILFCCPVLFSLVQFCSMFCFVLLSVTLSLYYAYKLQCSQKKDSCFMYYLISSKKNGVLSTFIKK
ncbi:hypothetical protein DCAR_0832403 [Daucus carota subsp. sativus]|uniref:BED-type domain-containing protein n=1 Tax=Daucus carota subsp. sativus TaxID=79200 RepID=A0AAF0XU84_DAUCS|nr:PREDICTED: zinc finger BED domain-containing protein RICESLEEPER 4-like [Daucus carota subsp. sativus]WOH12894.1 hypothetical protein DCAR_0832403 [Daucus carota subsp. sativus]